jgi:hypothetical protein
LPLLLPLPLPLPLPFTIAVAVAIAVTIAVAIAITHALIPISPLVRPLRLLIVVLSGGQSHRYQQWCHCHRHGCYLDNSIVIVAMAVLDDLSSPLPSTDRARFAPKPLLPTTMAAIR